MNTTEAMLLALMMIPDDLIFDMLAMRTLRRAYEGGLFTPPAKDSFLFAAQTLSRFAITRERSAQGLIASRWPGATSNAGGLR